jgi:arylsulfatase A-like enzyme
LTSTKLKNAFDLDTVDPKLRDRYDRTLFGSSALIARRLVEAGVRFVNVTWDFPGDNSWDTHANNFGWLRGALPTLDATYSALLADLEDHRLLDETLVVVMSDMGRTPQINGGAGRDHWTYCYSVLFAGAGIRGGTVFGASDAQAAYVKDRPVSTSDICATIYQCLGIDPEMPVYDNNRPVPVAHGGQPIREILA